MLADGALSSPRVINSYIYYDQTRMFLVSMITSPSNLLEDIVSLKECETTCRLFTYVYTVSPNTGVKQSSALNGMIQEMFNTFQRIDFAV